MKAERTERTGQDGHPPLKEKKKQKKNKTLTRRSGAQPSLRSRAIRGLWNCAKKKRKKERKKRKRKTKRRWREKVSEKTPRFSLIGSFKNEKNISSPHLIISALWDWYQRIIGNAILRLFIEPWTEPWPFRRKKKNTGLKRLPPRLRSSATNWIVVNKKRADCFLFFFWNVRLMTTGWRHPKPPIRSRSRRHRRRGVLFLISFFFCFFFFENPFSNLRKKSSSIRFFFSLRPRFFSGRNFAKEMRHPRRARRSTIRQRRAGCRRGCARRCRFYFFDDFFLLFCKRKFLGRPSHLRASSTTRNEKDFFSFFYFWFMENFYFFFKGFPLTARERDHLIGRESLGHGQSANREAIDFFLSFFVFTFDKSTY